MKRIISMLACAALIVCSCQKDPKPEVSFTSGNYVMGADEALTVKVYVPSTWGYAEMDGKIMTVRSDSEGSFVYVNIVPDSGEHVITNYVNQI